MLPILIGEAEYILNIKPGLHHYVCKINIGLSTPFCKVRSEKAADWWLQLFTFPNLADMISVRNFLGLPNTPYTCILMFWLADLKDG